MPFVKIQLLKGRDAAQKEKAAKKIIEIISTDLNVSKENVKVIFEDMKKENYYQGQDF